MAEQGDVCYTFEAAIEKAICMEDEGFRSYLSALRMVKDKGARLLLKDAALDELEHKHQLEKILVEGEMKADGGLRKCVPTMHLDHVLATQEIGPDCNVQEALAYAIHLEEGSIDYYKKMTDGCAGAPMAVLFEHLLADESRHLQALEDLYESQFLPEN